MQETVSEIKRKLYLFMNGVTSSSMKNKGTDYKLNFGVSIPQLRQIAVSYFPNEKLAENLWQENARELKILATMIYPPEKFHQAEHWLKSINNLELAEQASANLFCKMPDAIVFASGNISEGDIYAKICSFLIFTRLVMQGVKLDNEKRSLLLQYTIEALLGDSFLLKNVAFNTIQQFISQTQGQEDYFISFCQTYNKEDLIKLFYLREKN